MNIPVLACKVTGEGFQMWSHEVFTSHAAELNQEKFEQLTVLSELEKKFLILLWKASVDQQCSKERLPDRVRPSSLCI
jgi:hypothetical protein